MLKRPISWISAWQREQVTWETLARETGDSGFPGARTRCSPWQSVQVAAAITPAATAFPWMLSLYTSKIFWWHWAHVDATFCFQIFERGSEEGRMLCTPWQSLQDAAFRLPARIARPWTLCLYASTGSATENMYLAARAGLEWHFPHVSGRLALLTGDFASVDATTSCAVPWQLWQMGASPFNLAWARPWMLPLYSLTSVAWQVAQNWTPRVAGFTTSCVPWQAMQVELSLGSPNIACALALSLAATSSWQVRQEADAVFAVCPLLAAPAWQSTQPRSLWTLCAKEPGVTVMAFPWEFTIPVPGPWHDRQSSAA